MDLTEELLTEWTGLRGRDLSVFYLTYKQQASTALLYTNLEDIKQDILKFKDTVFNKKKSQVKSMIHLWESKIKRNM